LTAFFAACGGSGNQPVAGGTPAGETPATAAAPVADAPGSEEPERTSAASKPPAAAAPADVKPQAPRFREVTVPSGTTLRLTLQSAVASDSSRIEDAVRAELREPIEVDGRTALPAGTELTGEVTSVERSGRVKGLASVAYRFDALRHDGETYEIRTAVLSHEANATKGEDAKKIGIGAGIGAAIGGIVGGGDGAAKGAAIGGGAGTGAVLATRGKEVRLGPGAQVTTRLTEPLTLRISNR
jgi:hypothetical protein